MLDNNISKEKPKFFNCNRIVTNPSPVDINTAIDSEYLTKDLNKKYIYNKKKKFDDLYY